MAAKKTAKTKKAKPISPEISKDEKINKEIARLKKIFADLDKNKLNTVDSLIRTAAFITVSLDELQEIINREGYVDTYDHGGGQSGQKQSAPMQMHIAMTKNLTTIMKQLMELVPAEKKKASKLALLRDE